MESMTGFGRSESTHAGYCFTVEVKSVNHRYLDVRFRLPSTLSSLELPLSESLRERFERGAFDIVIKQRPATDRKSFSGGTKFLVDEMAAKSLVEGCEWLAGKHGIGSKPTFEAFLMSGKVFVPVEDAQDPGESLVFLKPLFVKALDELEGMRRAEGARLKKLLEAGLDELGKLGDKLAALAPTHPATIQAKLQERMQQWEQGGKLGGKADPQRIEWEIAFFADRADITEEIDRLRAHLSEFRKILGSGVGAMGRKLDFLTQELHREVNTMASKAALLDITRLTVDARSAIEKLREQVQNVE